MLFRSIQHGIQSSLSAFLKESGPTNSDLSPQVPKDFFTALGFHRRNGMSQRQICPPGMTNHRNSYSCSNSNFLKNKWDNQHREVVMEIISAGFPQAFWPARGSQGSVTDCSPLSRCGKGSIEGSWRISQVRSVWPQKGSYPSQKLLFLRLHPLL